MAMNSLLTTSHAMVRRFTHTFSYCHSSRYYLTIVQTLMNVKEDSVNVIKIVTIPLDRIPVPVTWAFLSTMMGYSAMVSITVHYYTIHYSHSSCKYASLHLRHNSVSYCIENCLYADIDECANSELQSCRQVCVNDVGSFHCECFPGYSLKDDQISCRGMCTWYQTAVQIFIHVIYKSLSHHQTWTSVPWAHISALRNARTPRDHTSVSAVKAMFFKMNSYVMVST